METAPAFGPDKLEHAAAGAALGLAASAGVAAWAPAWAPGWARRALALSAVAGVGVAKEAFDAAYPSRHTAELWDALATALGGAGGVAAGAAIGSADLVVALVPLEGGAAVVVSFRW